MWTACSCWRSPGLALQQCEFNRWHCAGCRTRQGMSRVRGCGASSKAFMPACTVAQEPCYRSTRKMQTRWGLNGEAAHVCCCGACAAMLSRSAGSCSEKKSLPIVPVTRNPYLLCTPHSQPWHSQALSVDILSCSRHKCCQAQPCALGSLAALSSTTHTAQEPRSTF